MTTAPQPDSPIPSPPPTFATAVRYWARLGCVNFGGPAGQIAMMHRDLVTERKWIDEPRFLHALNFCSLLPGPEAQQLATYVGWTLHGVRGGLAAGILFVLPSIFVLLGLSWIYAAHGALPAVAAVLAGVKAVVVAIVLDAVLRIGKRALKGPLAAGARHRRLRGGGGRHRFSLDRPRSRADRRDRRHGCLRRGRVRGAAADCRARSFQ